MRHRDVLGQNAELGVKRGHTPTGAGLRRSTYSRKASFDAGRRDRQWSIDGTEDVIDGLPAKGNSARLDLLANPLPWKGKGVKPTTLFFPPVSSL